MVYDCFTFFNELDLLEVRLNVLNAVVDRFVIAEATRTHRGKPKELLFRKNAARFSAFAGKITYVVVDDLLPEEEVERDVFNLPWVNENRQRNALARGLVDVQPEDVVMVSDLDEIPRPESVRAARHLLEDGRAQSVRFAMSFYNFYLNFRNFSCAKWMLGTCAIRFGSLGDAAFFRGVPIDRYTQAAENQGATLQKVRFLRADATLPQAGWHFSYLGGLAAIQSKLAAFSHSEFSGLPLDVLAARLKEGRDLFGRAGRSFGVALDGTFPRYIRENRMKFRDFLFPVDEDYLKRTRWSKRWARIRGCLYAGVVRLVPHALVPGLVRMRDRLLSKAGRRG